MRFFNVTSDKTLRDLASFLRDADLDCLPGSDTAKFKHHPGLTPILDAFAALQQRRAQECAEREMEITRLKKERADLLQREPNHPQPKSALIAQCGQHQDQANALRQTIGRMSDMLEAELRSNMQLLNHEASNLSEAAYQLNPSSEGRKDEASRATAKAQTAPEATDTVDNEATTPRSTTETTLEDSPR